MMDFLRRLAPPRESDPSRAVAVLPSRFARETPLRATVGQVRPTQRADGAEVPPTLDATSASAAIPAFTVQRGAVTGIRPSQAVCQLPDRGMPRVYTGKAISSTDVPACTRDIDVPEVRAFQQDRHGEDSEHAKPDRPEPQRAAMTLFAGWRRLVGSIARRAIARRGCQVDERSRSDRCLLANHLGYHTRTRS